MLRRILTICLLLLIVAGGSARAQSRFARNLIPGRLPLERVGLERQWYTVIPLVETEKLVKISRTDDLMFAQTTYARLHCIDPETGRMIWSAHLGERSGFALGATANSWAVFATCANQLFGLDRGTGRILWKVNLHTLPSSPPACDDSRVLVGMSNGMLMGHRLKYLDKKGNEHTYEKPIPLWNYHAGTAIRTRPIIAESLVAFGGGDNKAWVVMADEPTIIYRLKTGGPIGNGLGTYGTRTLLVPSADKVLYATDLLLAQILWQFPSGAPIVQEPLVAGDELYVINTEGSLSSLDPKTGQVRWTVPTDGGQLVSITPTKVYLRSFHRDLIVVDRASGKVIVDPAGSHLRAGLDLRGFEMDIVNRFNDRIFFATHSGMILSLREIGATQPQLLRDPKQLPFGYIPPEGIDLNTVVPSSAVSESVLEKLKKEQEQSAPGEEPGEAIPKNEEMEPE